MVTEITSSVLSIQPNSHSTWFNIIHPLIYSFPFIKRCVATCTVLAFWLLNIRTFIYSSPFIHSFQDPVSLKRPEAKHSFTHQERINVRQCAHLRHILSNILSIVNRSETNHILGRLQTFQKCASRHFLNILIHFLNISIQLLNVSIHFRNVSRHFWNVSA